MKTQTQKQIPLSELLKRITPLPHAVGTSAAGWPAIYNHKHKLICRFGDGIDECLEFDENYKNNIAYLAHAANVLPKMVDALARCACVIGHNSCSDGNQPNGFVVALDRARAALAEAETVNL